MNETKEAVKGSGKAPEKTREETLVDFRTAVANGEQQQVNNNGDQIPQPALGRMLDPVADRKVVHCAKCGHFLCDMIAYRVYLKMLCRQAECKAQNEVTVDGNDIRIFITPRDARARGTMRL